MKLSFIAKNKDQYDAAVAAGFEVRMMGEKFSDNDIANMTFTELRVVMLREYIPCGGCRTKEELLVVYHRDFALDKKRLPLYNKREAKGHLANMMFKESIRGDDHSDGRVGLVPCMNPECFEAENGCVAFTPCKGCNGPMYCSDKCADANFSVHGGECDDLKKERDRDQKSDASIRDFIFTIASMMGNK